MERDRASSTAVLVCQGRAVAQGRIAVGRFDDPVAMELLRDDERRPVEEARGGVPPKGWAARMRYEMLRANAEVMVPRTVAIDDAIREARPAQLVILGAGLDGRAWRMAELAATDVFEVDHPASQRDKRRRLGERRPLARSVRFVAVDFSVDDLGMFLDAAGHSSAAATTWVWEGVVAYLTPAEVRTTLDVVAHRSAPGSRIVVNYQSPSPVATVGHLISRTTAKLTRSSDPLAAEPRRSAWTPATMGELLAAHHFQVLSDLDLGTIADRLGVPVRNARSVRAGRVAVAHRPGTGSGD